MSFRRPFRRARLIGLLLLAGPPCAAQSTVSTAQSTVLTAQSTQSTAVAGQLLSTRDGHPLAHAKVTLSPSLSGTSSKQRQETTTDDAGRFHFDAVPPGKYGLTGTAPGYLPSAYLEHEGFSTAIVTGVVEVATDNLVLQLNPKALIAGRITDEAGDPVAHANVALYREDPSAATKVSRYRNARSDDIGGFEFASLAPGRYYLSASATPWYAVHPSPDPPNGAVPYRSAVDPALDVAFPLTFYPHALSSADATAITVRGGDEVAADLQLIPERAVSLQLPAPAPGQPPRRYFQLLQPVFSNEEPVPAPTDYGNGSARISGIPPGHYQLREIGRSSLLPSKMRPIDLSTDSALPTDDDAADNASLAKVTVKLHAESGAGLPSPLAVRLSRADDGSPNGFGQLWQNPENGIVSFENVPAGVYQLNAVADGRFLRVVQIAVAGKAASDRRLHLTGAEPVAVDLTISARSTRIEGFARHGGKPDAGALVLLVPANKDSGPELFRRDQSDLDGSFTLQNVMPGNYLLVVIDNGWGLRWTDTATLTPYLLHALPVRVEEAAPALLHLPETLNAQPR